MSSDQALESLRIPKSLVDTINHPQEYIHGIGKDKKPFRKIFKNTEFDEKEKLGIQQLKQLVASQKVVLPENFDDSDYLKFVYTGKFEAKNGLEALTKNLEWRNSMRETITQEALRLLQQGVFYQNGRDKQYRPIIILNIHKIDPKHNSEEHTLEALCYFLKKIQSTMFYPGKIENWIIILETNKMSFFKFPIGILKMIIQTLSVNFNATLEHLFILNPSTSFNVIWGGASSFIDSAQKQKISFIGSKKEMKKLYDKIELQQLENKYGGQLDDIQNNFWPPKNTIQKLGDPSVLDVDEEAMENRQSVKQSQVEQLKDFSKNIDGRISVLKNRPTLTIQKSENNPLEDQLMKKSMTGTTSYHSIRPSIPHYYDNSDRVSVLSGYSRPSNRTIYKSAFSSFMDFDAKQIDNIKEEREEIYYSFHSCLEVLPEGQQEEKKQWQKWTVIGDESSKQNNTSSTHTAEDKLRVSLKYNQLNPQLSNNTTDDHIQKRSSQQDSANLSENNQRSTNESRQSKKTTESHQKSISIPPKENSIVANNSKVENGQQSKSKPGDRYGRESFQEQSSSKIQYEKDKEIKKKNFCC